MLVEMAEGEAVEVAVAVDAKKINNTTGFYNILKKCAIFPPLVHMIDVSDLLPICNLYVRLLLLIM